MFSFEKLPGLSRERVVDAIEPVLRAHGLQGVELVWRTDERGRVLQVTVERSPSPSAGASGSEVHELDTSELDISDRGAGVTLELCALVSRDLSTALDVAEAIDARYRLEVGTPGIERALYTLADYRRFRGRKARLKLKEPVAGQRNLEAQLAGVDDAGAVRLTVQGGEVAVPLANISSGRLAVDWQALGFSGAPLKPGSKRPAVQR
jgi:ribosome maturation factor RimP